MENLSWRCDVREKSPKEFVHGCHRINSIIGLKLYNKNAPLPKTTTMSDAAINSPQFEELLGQTLESLFGKKDTRDEFLARIVETAKLLKDPPEDLREKLVSFQNPEQQQDGLELFKTMEKKLNFGSLLDKIKDNDKPKSVLETNKRFIFPVIKIATILSGIFYSSNILWILMVYEIYDMIK